MNRVTEYTVRLDETEFISICLVVSLKQYYKGFYNTKFVSQSGAVK